MTPTVAKVIKKFEIDLQNAFKEDKIRSMFADLDLTPKCIHFHKLYDKLGTIFLDKISADFWNIKKLINQFPPVNLLYYKSGCISSIYTRSWMDNLFDKNPNLSGQKTLICPLMILWNNYDGYQLSWVAEIPGVGLMDVKCDLPSTLISNIWTRKFLESSGHTKVDFSEDFLNAKSSSHLDANYICWSNSHDRKTPNNLTLYFNYLLDELDALEMSLEIVRTLESVQK